MYLQNIYKIFLKFLGQGCTSTGPRCPVGACLLGPVKTIWCSKGVASNFKSSHTPLFNDTASYPSFLKLLEGQGKPRPLKYDPLLVKSSRSNTYLFDPK